MTDFSDTTDKANAVVNRWIFGRYRGQGDNEHLRSCPDLALGGVEGYDSGYGCDTGCDYVRFEATASCSHGMTDDFEWGTFGELSYILEDILADEEAAI